MANTFKKVIDRQMWVPVPASPNAHAAGASLCSDLRNDLSRNPFVFQLVSATVLNRYHIVRKAWNFVQSPALTGTFGAGAASVFAPSMSLMGNIGTGSNTTTVVTSTVLTAVGVNMLANRGGGSYGFRIRIKGNASGSSGKTEERWIVANTGGTTPTFTLDSALTFSPISGDTYEILGGKVFMLSAGTTAAGCWKSIEVSTNALSGNLSIVNLPASIATDSVLFALDEQYVPHNHKPGEGFVIGASQYDGTSKYCLLATATAAGTITGQATGGDASVLANEYRNFQIRIVEDTTAPTAVGQRRIIASHTAGASPVYTLGAAWTVTPSNTAKYVIEYPNLIIGRSSATTTVYTYNYTGASLTNGTNTIAADAWSITYFQAGGGANGAGNVIMPAFGITPDPAKNARHSHVFFFRGAATSTLDLLDIAGAINGTWSASIVYDGGVTFTTGSSGEYAPSANEGRFGYMNSYANGVINQIYRFDVKNRVLSPETPTDWIQAGTAAAGQRLTTYVAIDGTDKYTFVFLQTHLSTISYELLVLA